jgi:prolyl 4-hydroxylase
MITEIESFLSEEECNELVTIIDANHTRSSVVEGGTDISTVSETRTSSTCNLDSNNELVSRVHNKIAIHLGQQLSKGEGLQGQLYEQGQFFKPHNDYFSGSAYDKHCLQSGNRTFTLMIYLNDDFEGGGTNFPNMDLKVKPKRGKAVIWQNTIDGIGQEKTLHEGQSIDSGKKYIITSWWRENDWNGAEDAYKYKNKKKIYTDKSQIPKLTEKGFKVVKCPDVAWGLIQDAYNILKDKKTEEKFENKENVIIGGGSDILSFEHLPSIRATIHKELQPLHEEFCGVSIEPSFIYGIRSYTKGATLINHVDRVETHHISSIIIVDKDLRCGCQHKKFADDWPLDIQDHDGNWHKVYAEVGDIILYESAICEHGRQEPFGGEYFRNFFVHYKLV